MSDRVLIFPDDDEVGRVHTWSGSEHRSVPARGRVHVPAGASVTLCPASAIRGLESLRPDDVQTVHLESWRPTDDDFARLAHLTGLVYLIASKSQKVTDRGLAAIRPLRRLRELDLYHSSVTDEGLRHLAGMVELREVHLGATRVEGPGLRWLAGLPHLEKLNLHDTDIDDAAVPLLLAFRGLQRLCVCRTLLSVKGLAALRAGFPHLAWDLHERAAGQRLARERVRRAVRRILAGRILPHLPEGTALGHELAAVRVFAIRRPGGTVVPLNEGLEDEQAVIARYLAGQPFGSDLRVVGPGGLDVWVPWLRSRGSDRRAARR